MNESNQPAQVGSNAELGPLLACPFCGGTPVLEDCRTAWIVRCQCGASVLGERAPEPEEEMPAEYWRRFEASAVLAWNRRDGEATHVAAERERCANLCNKADKSTHPADLADAIRRA